MVVSDGSLVELLWSLRERPSRGPKPSVTIDQIAKAAMAVADAEGLEALSMQRVAGELGLTKMALYRYVAGKDELIAVMIEEAVGEPPNLDRVRGGWRARLERYATLLWQTWEQHPWVPGATVGARVMGPKEVGWVESAVRALSGTGLDGPSQMNAVQLISGHIRNTQAGNALGSFPWNADHRLDPAMTDLLLRHKDRYPALTAAAAGAGQGDARTFGLQRILDGLEVLIEQKAGR